MRSALFLKLLEKRGFGEEFLAPKYEKLSDPFLLPDMAVAVLRIKQAVEGGEKILIYGDYDVDGVTATAELYEVLRLAGVRRDKIIMMLPDRFLDGYGMSTKVVQRAKTEGVGLVITVDCGSNNGEVIDELNAAGVEVVVTDHHEVMGEVPRAVAVVNAKRKDVEVEPGLKELCGAGVAFFLARAMVKEGLIPEGQEKWLLDLAMIGTICDAMEVTGENRIICWYGVLVLGKTRRVGLKELMKHARVKKIDSDAIGFQIGPRLNAGGRMESAEISLKLLLAKTQSEAVNLAAKLERLNAERKSKQEQATREAESRAPLDEPVIVAAGEWHEGIVGIVAGNLTEKYKKPALALTEVEGGILKGSGRSFGEFSLAEAMKACQEYLIAGGGHAGACGLKLEKGKLKDFTRAINAYYESLDLKNQERFLEEREDLTVGKLESISLEFMNDLELLQPFGPGNPEPRILLSEVKVKYIDRMGKEGQHLKLTVSDREQKLMRLIAFGAPEEWFDLRPGEAVSILMSPTVNEWDGISSVEGYIKKIVRS